MTEGGMFARMIGWTWNEHGVPEDGGEPGRQRRS